MLCDLFNEQFVVKLAASVRALFSPMPPQTGLPYYLPSTYTVNTAVGLCPLGLVVYTVTNTS